MDSRRLLDELHDAAGKLGIEVRREPFGARSVGGAGGLCRLRGRDVILLDSGASLTEQSAALAEALARFDLEQISLAPQAREFVETARKRVQWRESPPAPRAPPRDNVKPLPRAKPGVRSTRRRRGDR